MFKKAFKKANEQFLSNSANLSKLQNLMTRFLALEASCLKPNSKKQIFKFETKYADCSSQQEQVLTQSFSKIQWKIKNIK